MGRVFVSSDIFSYVFAFYCNSLELVVEDVSATHAVPLSMLDHTLHLLVACKALDVKTEEFSDPELKGGLNPGKGVQILLVWEEGVYVGLGFCDLAYGLRCFGYPLLAENKGLVALHRALRKFIFLTFFDIKKSKNREIQI